MDEQPCPASGGMRRPDGLLPVNGLEVQRARAGHLHAEYGLHRARLSQHGSLDLVRIGQPHGPAPILRRSPGRPRIRAERPQQPFRRILARPASGHDDSGWARECHSRPLSAAVGRLRHTGERAGRPEGAGAAQSRPHGRPARRQPPRSTHRGLRDGRAASSDGARGLGRGRGVAGH